MRARHNIFLQQSKPNFGKNLERLVMVLKSTIKYIQSKPQNKPLTDQQKIKKYIASRTTDLKRFSVLGKSELNFDTNKYVDHDVANLDENSEEDDRKQEEAKIFKR